MKLTQKITKIKNHRQKDNGSDVKSYYTTMHSVDRPFQDS